MTTEGRLARSQQGTFYVECYQAGDTDDGHFQLVTNCPLTAKQVRQALERDPVRVGPVQQSHAGVYVVGLFDEDHDTEGAAIVYGRPAQWTELVLLACMPQ